MIRQATEARRSYERRHNSTHAITQVYCQCKGVLSRYEGRTINLSRASIYTCEGVVCYSSRASRFTPMQVCAAILKPNEREPSSETTACRESCPWRSVCCVLSTRGVCCLLALCVVYSRPMKRLHAASNAPINPHGARPSVRHLVHHCVSAPQKPPPPAMCYRACLARRCLHTLRDSVSA